jgi:DnaJ-class molecular chaperone
MEGQEKHPNETVTGCPRCEGTGAHIKPLLPPKTYVGQDDFMRCEMCEGSGKVFVVPARVIGPAPK